MQYINSLSVSVVFNRFFDLISGHEEFLEPELRISSELVEHSLRCKNYAEDKVSACSLFDDIKQLPMFAFNLKFACAASHEVWDCFGLDGSFADFESRRKLVVWDSFSTEEEVRSRFFDWLNREVECLNSDNVAILQAS